MDILNRKSLKDGKYFDDVYDNNSLARKYRQILFHPGRPLQVRELTQIQSLINEYDKNYLDTVFKNGSVIEGCSLSLILVDNDYIHINEGLVYFDGTCFKTDEIFFEITNDLNSILLSNQNINLHIIVKYNIVNNDDDGSDEKNALLDPAISYFDNESIIGADRLRITFELMLSIVDSSDNIIYFFQDGTNSTEFDYNTNHIFDFAKAVLTPATIPVYELSNIIYLNRESKINSIDEINSDVDNEIIQGLIIQQSNIVDTNLNVDLRADIDSGDTKNNISNVIIDKGVGKIGDKYIPVSRNTVFRLDKMEETDETLKNNKEISFFYKETSNEKEGLYFKYYFNENKDENIGCSIFKFDHPNNEIFLNVGTKIAIEAYDTYKYRTLAKANITHVDENDFVNTNINDVNIWDKFKYKGFWRKNENFVYIQGLINSSDVGTGVGIYRDSTDLTNRTLKITGVTTNEIFRHAVNGGIQAVGQRYEYSDVKFVEKAFYSDYFAGKDNYTNYIIENQDIRDDFDAGKIPIHGAIIILNNKMYYTRDITADNEASNQISANLFLIRYKTNRRGETYITTVCTDDISISETNTCDVSFIRYHVIEEIVNDSTIKIEYNSHVFNNSTSTWSSLPSSVGDAEEFIILTSPVEDIKGYRTVIKNNITDQSDIIESKFIMSTPPIPYLYTKYAFFCDSFHHTNSENTIKVIDYVELEASDTEDRFHTFNRQQPSTEKVYHSNYYIYEITLDQNLDNINEGDILYSLSSYKANSGSYVFSWTEIIMIVTEKIADNKIKVVTGFELPWLETSEIVINIYNYTKSVPLYGSEVINGVPFWKIHTIDTRILNYTDLNIYNSKNSYDYGSDTDLQDFDITYYNTKFKKIFISDIQLEDGESIETLYDNSISTRIVLLDVDDNLDYSHVIEEGIELNGTKDLIIDIDNNTIFNDFNDLSIPYVKDDLIDYSLYTLYNVEKTFNEIDPEGNENWAQFNFTEDDKILGAYQAHGKAVFNGSKAFIKMRSADMPILSDTDWANTLPHLASVCYCELEDIEFDYIVNHQGNITKETGSGDLGINLYHFEDSNYVQSLSFCIGSLGEGSAIENRDYKVVDDLGNDISVYNALGLKYYFNLDLSSDFNSASKNGSNVLYYEAKITDTKVNTVYRDEDDKHLIHIERTQIFNDTVDVTTDSYNTFIGFKIDNITKFKIGDIVAGDVVTLYKKDGDEIVVAEYGTVKDSGVGVNYTTNIVTIILDSVIVTNPLLIKQISFDSKLDFTDYAIDDVIYFLYSDVHVPSVGSPPVTQLPKVLEFDFYRIKEIVSSTSVRVYEEVPDKYLKIPASQKPYVLQAVVSGSQESIVISANASNKLWVPYENNYSFVLNSYVGGINIATFDVNQLSKSPLYCSVITTEELTPDSTDSITLSLYKEVDKDDIETESVEGIYIKNIEFKDSYHPFMRIRENHTSLYGKPLSYYHKPLKVNVADSYFKEVKYEPMVTTQYEYILPEIVHFHLNSEGEINYTKTVPVMYNEIKPLYIQNELYLGTVTVPPIEKDAIPEGGATPMAFLNTQTQLFNLKRDLELKFENVENKNKIKTNSNYISLNDVYNMERRDLHFSTGKKFVWWEQLGGTIKPTLSVRYRIYSANGYSASNSNMYYGYEWNKILGSNTSFKTDLNTGDTIAVYKTVYDYTNDALNITNEPTSLTHYNPTETFIVKQILSNNELIIDGEMTTTRAYTLDAGEIIVLPESFIWNRDRMVNHSLVTDPSVYFEPSFFYVRREQDINFIQYLMNNREYSIFNIINNNYVFEDDYKILNLKKDNFKFNKIKCDDIYFRKPRVDIYNNEISPITYLYSRQLDLESEIEFEEYSNGNMTLAPIVNGDIKIIDTKEYNSGSIETGSEDDVFDINYTLNSISGVGAKLYDRDNAINGSYILNTDGKDLKWDFSRNKAKNYEDGYSDSNNDFTEFQYFDFSKDLEKQNVDYNYYITHKLKRDSSEFVKQTFKPTIGSSKSTGFTNIILDTTPEKKILNGVSALTMANDVHLVCENNVVNYDSLTEFLSGTNELIKLRPSIYDMINGIYDVGVINTDISIDGDENILSNTYGYNFLKVSTNILCNESFNNIGEDFSYIFNQIGHCVYFDRYFTDDETIAGRNIYSVFDEINREEVWEFVKPTIYQVYQFKESYMLNNINFYLDAQGVVGEKYTGNIAVYFGFLINDNITKSGIVRTIIKNVNMSSLEYKDGKVSVELDTPIYVPKNKKFFIGFIKETSSTPNDCSFKYIENGGYDIEDDILISYPANCDSELWLNGVKTTNRMLKIDLTVNQYEKNTVFDIQTSTLDLTATNTTILKFMALSTIVVPEDTSIIFTYATDIIGTDTTWKVFEINDMISLSESYQKLAFKVSVKSNNNFLSPIFKKNFLIRLEHLMFSDIYADDIKIKKLTYNQMLEKFRPFAWRFLGGGDTVNFFPVGISVDNIKNRLNKYDTTYGRILQKSQFIFDKSALPNVSYNPITIPKIFGN